MCPNTAAWNTALTSVRPGSSLCHLIWSRSSASQSKRSHGLAAEQVNHILRRHEGLAALLPGTTLETLFILPLPYDLEQLHLPTCPHSTWPLLQFYFLGRLLSGLSQRDSSLSLSVGMTEIQIIANGFLFSTTLLSQKRSCVHVHK